jgi:hypothetical protein
VEFGWHAEVIEKQHEIDRRRQMAGCFVLLTNVPSEGEQGYSAEEILCTYKEQHAIERNFGFLKDDQIVNALFLKRPERIEALGLVLLISLLIWRLIEHAMRTDVFGAHGTSSYWLLAVKEKHPAYGQKDPCADRRSDGMARDHSVGGRVEPHDAWLGELLSSRDHPPCLSCDRQLHHDAVASVVAQQAQG